MTSGPPAGRATLVALPMPPVARGRAELTGRAGLAASLVSVVLTFGVAAAGPSVMEPALPGGAGQPPWSFAMHLPAGLAIGLAATALACGATGLGLCLYAARHGWAVSPHLLLGAGLIAAAALTVVPPFGSADHLSYAAYGRMAVTGHDPYSTTPATLARLGDPVARAVQDWRHSPSVYGSAATGLQALAAEIGGRSARGIVFVLSLLNLAAFAGTGLLAHWLARGRRDRQMRAALLWTANPLLLQVLVAGAHVDGLAVFCAVSALALFTVSLRYAPRATGHPTEPPTRGHAPFLIAAGAGAAVGLAFAVKVSLVLVLAGLVLAAALALFPHDRSRWQPFAVVTAGLACGFAVVAATAFIPWGTQALGPALRAGSYVSIGSPWRPIRSALRLATGEAIANDLVRAGAVILAVALLALFARPLAALARNSRGSPAPGLGRAVGHLDAEFCPCPGDPPDGLHQTQQRADGLHQTQQRADGLHRTQQRADGLHRDRADGVTLAAAAVFAVVFAWLVAWTYVLPWYDSLAWALLAVLPWLPRPWAALDWLVLARTTALAFGYLPARGIALPTGLTWLHTVIRTGITPVLLLGTAVLLVVALRSGRCERNAA